jgi:hemin uptake protein HemP
MYIRLRSCCCITVALVGACLLATSVWAHPGSGIAVDGKGQVYFLDTGSGPWKIDAQGALSHLPGPRFHWLTIDANNAFAHTTLPSGANGDIARSGANPTLLLSSDVPVAIGHDGNLYYPSGSAGNLKITRMKPSGETSVLAILPETANGPLPHLNGIAAGPDNSIYYTENDVVRRITAKGDVSIVANVPALIGGPSIPGTDAHPLLRGLAIDAEGTMYVADNGDARVLKVTPDGKTITTLLQLESPWSPTAIALSGDDVYVQEFLHTDKDDRLAWLPRVRKITPDGQSTILATVDKMPGAR